VYGKIPDSGPEDVNRAVSAAKTAFKSWSKTPKQERSKILLKIADLVESRMDQFASAESKDQGKPFTLAKTVDIPRVCANFRFFAGAILHHEERATDMDGVATNYTVRTPVGVAGLISPWNLPLYLLTWKLAPALAVGCTVVCKPSEFASVTSWMLCGVMKEAGLPDGVCNMVFGRGPVSGKLLVTHPEVPLISFTGGTATGEHIIRDSAPHYKKLYLELGGKNPNVIFDDCNLEECVNTTIRSSFSNQGEICLCGSRILVQEGIYDKFMKLFVEKTKQLVVGDPRDAKTNVGALVSKEHREKVEYYIDLAKKEGGTIVCGGDRPNVGEELKDGYYLNPTIITGLSPNCRTQQEEIFGPVVGITTFKTEEEAIEMANCVKYGLAATLWTENLGRAHRVAQAIESGTVWVNCWMMRDLRVPFGGVKHSGLGRASGEASIDFYTEQKNICIKFA
jgi:aminomuconate-semialdehyde/2-hydroxymuconate-6-semialdehyde dehydrogenase